MDRAIAYASPELAACDRDSPLFISLVTRSLPGLAGGQFHRVLTEIWFTDAAALRTAAAHCHNSPAYAVREHEFI